MKDYPLLADDPLWYKDAVIYELHLRAFLDTDADGVGDLPGLIERLDYLEELGVTALWLLPFYPSPLKDDGYDISDYVSINPTYGTVQQFKTFLHEAHDRGIRVITELVLNHTSDQHPWFLRAKRAEPGSPYRDFYVWSDSPDRYRDARVIFKDFEPFNWSWDPEACAYYWHRFYAHQPDLNYDSPAVQQAVLDVVNFWFNLGVDGLRVDAVPYLFEREGTTCENLPETHAFLKLLRRHVDKNFRDRMLLAEANQWPDDAAEYFGDGDEFHMAFHFPLMPRLFMSLRMADRFPLVDILRQTPRIPENSQWALFLRNHDELTLEMVTDEERDYMYRMYATDPEARINLGIRRRLAPLLNNDRRKIELLNGLLLSMPGTPVIYYGDEIGMGENIYLGDRNSVRTPMQWSADRNGGFSRANPQKLYLPLIIDPEYHYEAFNVETLQDNPDSLLWWMKRMIGLRKRFKAFGRGSTEYLYPRNRKVLTFLRRHGDETVLVVANLSGSAQQVEIDLGAYAGRQPIELVGSVEFAPLSEAPYPLTLGPYGFYWFSLEPQPIVMLPGRDEPPARLGPVPLLTVEPDRLFLPEMAPALERVLVRYLRGQRWFRGKARKVRSCRVADVLPVEDAHLLIVRMSYEYGEDQVYVVSLTIASGEEASRISREHPNAVIAQLEPPGDQGPPGILYEALASETFCRTLVKGVAGRRRFKGRAGLVQASATPSSHHLGSGKSEFPPQPRLMQAEQTNTSVVFGDQLILKVFRQIEEGTNPEIEIGRCLSEESGFANVPPMAGTLEYVNGKQEYSLAVLQRFVPNEGDAWEYTLDDLARYAQEVLRHPRVQIPPIPRRPLALLDGELPGLATETIGPYLSSMRTLGQRTAELHAALASMTHRPGFAPERFTTMNLKSMYQSVRASVLRTFEVLGDQLKGLPDEAMEDAEALLAVQDRVLERLAPLRSGKLAASRIRCHGDYHLGQVLYTGRDFVIIDFEGEPARPLSERRLKRSPLHDIAGMIRSFHYATQSILRRFEAISGHPPEELMALDQWLRFWYIWVSVTFLQAYREHLEPANIIPASADDLRGLLDAYLIDKALYEIGYELNNRPDWVRVPLRGMLSLVDER